MIISNIIDLNLSLITSISLAGLEQGAKMNRGMRQICMARTTTSQPLKSLMPTSWAERRERLVSILGMYDNLCS